MRPRKPGIVRQIRRTGNLECRRGAARIKRDIEHMRQLKYTMARLRIVSVVEDSWGCGIVYGDEKELGPQQESTTKDEYIMSKTSIREEVDYNTNEQKGSDDEQHESKSYGLTYLQASMFATILEDTLMEIRILLECNNELRVEKTHVDMNILVSLKFEIAQPDSKDELEGIDPHFLGNSDYKLNKLDADRKYFKQVIETLYKEMTLYKTFDTLHGYVDFIIRTEHDRIFLCEDEAKNKLFLRELNKQLRHQRNRMKSVIYDTDCNIDALKAAVEDSTLNSEIQSRYVENWQRARTEQHIQTISDKEATPTSIIEYYKRRSDYEQRVHAEVELLTNIAINETLEKVEQWMNKYDKDMEGLDLKIQIKKNDYQNQLDNRIDLENTFEKHDIMMKEWIHFKEEREKARQYCEKMTKAAVVVQAWWRGLLVRRNLGPYKVAKKKGGTGKKK